MNKNKKIIVIACLSVLAFIIIRVFLVTGIIWLVYSNAKVEINEDITKYNQYMFENSKEEYQNKWDMDETIFPKKITSNMNVIDYKMVYYNPWDKQFLSYLVVDYNDADYNEEMERLKSYKSTNYIGYYSVTGFSKYDLVSMYADSYNGFVYAITNNQNRIIYVELIFCNYFYDLDYKKYISIDYLPDNFDATLDNLYMKKMNFR